MGKYILFDMDGVLVNTEPMHFEIWKKVFKEKGIDIDYEHYKGCIGSTRSFLYNLIKGGIWSGCKRIYGFAGKIFPG